MEGTWVWALVWEDPTCRGATKPVSCNYWAWALQSLGSTWATTAARSLRTAMKSSPHSSQKAWQQHRPRAANNKEIFKKKERTRERGWNCSGEKYIYIYIYTHTYIYIHTYTHTECRLQPPGWPGSTLIKHLPFSVLDTTAGTAKWCRKRWSTLSPPACNTCTVMH